VEGSCGCGNKPSGSINAGELPSVLTTRDVSSSAQHLVRKAYWLTGGIFVSSHWEELTKGLHNNLATSYLISTVPAAKHWDIAVNIQLCTSSKHYSIIFYNIQFF
jgi:hypothetical protein